MSSFGRVAILGAGAWGTALALVASRAGRETLLLARDQQAAATMRRTRANADCLPDVALDPAIAITAEPGAAAGADLVLLAVPAQALRSSAEGLAPKLAAGTPVVICAKGIESGTGRRLSEVLAETVPAAIPAVLSGPSFAADVARGLPTAVTVAADDAGLAFDICRAIAGPAFRPYAETDVIGVELGGALKNVLAIAAGIVAGRGLGASALAALVARGFAELRRFAEAAGARPETLMGLSGLGDLVLTCSGPQSRNFALGQAIGAGRPRPPALAEGAATAAIARDLARRRSLSMPVTEAVADVLDGILDVGAAVGRLMSRPLRHEADRPGETLDGADAAP